MTHILLSAISELKYIQNTKKRLQRKKNIDHAIKGCYLFLSFILHDIKTPF